MEGSVIKDLLKREAKVLFAAGYPLVPSKIQQRIKEYFELHFWRKLHQELYAMPDDERNAELAQGESIYAYFYTTFFELSQEAYRDKRILDIGCGPMGSLEWATLAALRVGLDPLANSYRRFGTDLHSMTYVEGVSEAIPYPDASFDFVTSFNSLDHVDDVARTASEIKRVTAPNGSFLLITEINHLPRPTEPHQLDASLIELFQPEFEAQSVRLFGIKSDHDIYGSLFDGLPYQEGRPGLLCADMRKLESRETRCA